MLVVDTNIIAALFLESDQFEVVELLLDAHPDWRVPYLWKSEFRNVLNQHRRAGRLSLERTIELQMTAEAYLHQTSSSPDSAHVLSLAAQSGCTPYDCEFVSTAVQLGVALVTFDKKLLAAFPDVAKSPMTILTGGSPAP